MKRLLPRSGSWALAASLLLAASTSALAQSAADRAVEAAKEFSGSEITVLYEAGLQALEATQFAGPKWEELTGIKVNVVESPVDEIFTRIMQAHRAGTGSFDVVNVIPNQMPDLALSGALEPLDAFVEKYDYAAELETIAPVYRDNWMRVEDKIYGLPDDGDVLVLYYRKDIFEDPETMAEFREAHDYDLAPPETWEQYREIGQFLTDKLAPRSTARRALPARQLPVRRPAALPRRGRALLRPRDHEGDDQLGSRRAHARRHPRRPRDDAQRRRAVGLHREPQRAPVGRSP
jgi:ABC-type glycerol-3-phosphate transport system substrate-binding protein